MELCGVVSLLVKFLEFWFVIKCLFCGDVIEVFWRRWFWYGFIFFIVWGLKRRLEERMIV